MDVGDMISDVLTGINAHCRGSILVRTGKGLTEDEARLDIPYMVADDLFAALGEILGNGQEAATQAPVIEPSSVHEGSTR